MDNQNQQDPLGILGGQPKKVEQPDPLGILKKKASETALKTGGKAGTSVLPSGLTPSKIEVKEYKEPIVGEDTMLTRKMERAQKQAISGTEVRLPAAPKAVAAERGMQRAVEPMVEKPTAKQEQSWLSNTVSALDRGFYKNLVGNPIKGLGTLLQYGTAKLTGGTGREVISDALIQFGDYFNKAIDEVAPQDESFKGSLSDQFAQALGQVGSIVITGGIGAGGKGAALAEQAIPKAVLTGGAGKVAPVVAATKEAGKKLVSELATPATVSAGLTVGQSEFDRAKKAGATDEQAFEAFYKNAAVGSILEKIPVMQFFKRFNNATQGGFANYLKTKGVAGLTGGLEEATTEVLQQVYSNKTAKDIYNANQDIFEGLTESGGIGFGVGFLLNAMGANAKILRKEGKEAEAQLVDAQINEFKSRAEKGPQVPTAPSPVVAEEKVVTPTEEVKAEEVVQPVGEVEAAPKVPEFQIYEFGGKKYEVDRGIGWITEVGMGDNLYRISSDFGKRILEEGKPEGVGEVVPQAAPQVPAAEEKTYRVEYFDPETRKMTHQMFATEAEGEAFKKTLTREQTSQGVTSYFEKAPAKGVGEVVTEAAPQVPAAPVAILKEPSERKNGLSWKLFDGKKEVGSVVVSKKEGQGFKIANVVIAEDSQKKGIATKAYIELNDKSIKETGLPLSSGLSLNEKSEKLWSSLVKKGLAEKLENGQYQFVSKITPQVPVAPVEALKDVESTTKALQSEIDKGFKFTANFGLPFEQLKTPNQVSEAYHKAKAEGTNPVLVKAVEDLFVGEVAPEAAPEVPMAPAQAPVIEGKVEAGEVAPETAPQVPAAPEIPSIVEVKSPKEIKQGDTVVWRGEDFIVEEVNPKGGFNLKNVKDPTWTVKDARVTDEEFGGKRREVEAAPQVPEAPEKTKDIEEEYFTYRTLGMDTSLPFEERQRYIKKADIILPKIIDNEGLNERHLNFLQENVFVNTSKTIDEQLEDFSKKLGIAKEPASSAEKRLKETKREKKLSETEKRKEYAIQEQYNKILDIKDLKKQKSEKLNFIDSNFDSIVSQLILKNRIKRIC